jgi:hypothetical protein
MRCLVHWLLNVVADLDGTIDTAGFCASAAYLANARRFLQAISYCTSVDFNRGSVAARYMRPSQA